MKMPPLLRHLMPFFLAILIGACLGDIMGRWWRHQLEQAIIQGVSEGIDAAMKQWALSDTNTTVERKDTP